eukprot:3483837-Prymnesium_polylepis.1
MQNAPPDVQGGGGGGGPSGGAPRGMRPDARLVAVTEELRQAAGDLSVVVESQEQLRRVTEGQPDMEASIASVMRRFQEQEASLRERPHRTRGGLTARTGIRALQDTQPAARPHNGTTKRTRPQHPAGGGGARGGTVALWAAQDGRAGWGRRGSPRAPPCQVEMPAPRNGGAVRAPARSFSREFKLSICVCAFVCNAPP